MFILGLIVVVSFPILSLTNKGFKKSKEVTDMMYISEMAIENLKLKDEISLSFLKELEKIGELEYPHLKDENYISKVRLLDEHPGLWDLIIKTHRKDNEGGREYVEIKATIPK